MHDLSLKKVSISDFEIWKDVCGNIELDEYDVIFDRILDQEKKDQAYSFWLWDKNQNIELAFVQVFNVLRFPSLSGCIEISVSEKYRNQGYGKIAIKLLEDFVFNELKLLKLIAPILPENQNSIKLFTSLNFFKVHDDPYAFFIKRKPVMHSIYIKLSPNSLT